MGGTASRRTSPLPKGWKRIRAAILVRDGSCVAIDQGVRCGSTERLEVDHIGDPDDHSWENLRTLCHWHHARRTGRQAAAARRHPHAPAGQHPGLIR